MSVKAKHNSRENVDDSSSPEREGDLGSGTKNSREEQEPKKPSAQILRHELKEAQDALDRPANRLLFSSMSAGLELGFSLLLMSRMRTMFDGQLPVVVEEVLVANMYAFGFLLVVIGRSELFTEQTSLAVLPVLNRQASVGALLRLWGLVYLGNLIGAVVIAGLLVVIGPAMKIIDPAVFETIARHVVDHPAWVIVCSGLLAGWLMGLLSWLVAAGRDTISQIVIVWAITTAIGLGHLHHVVAGSVEVLSGLFSSPEITLLNFGHFLLWTTLGNALGGPFFVGLLKFAIAHDNHAEAAHGQFG